MRRRRDFRYPATPGQPKFKVGDKVGNFEILAYIGQSTVHPAKATVLSKDHHWYKGKCVCGATEVVHQQTLVDKRRKRQCSTCSKGN